MSDPQQDPTTAPQRPPLWPVFALFVVVVGGVGAFLAWPTNAADDSDSEKKSDDSRFQVPDGTPKELMGFAKKLLEKDPEKEDAPKIIKAIPSIP